MNIFLKSKKFIKLKLLILMAIFLSSCATESHRSIVPETVKTYNTAYSGKKLELLVNNFVNKSDYQNGLFSTGSDRLGNQAKTILKTHLNQTNRFIVVDRDNMEAIKKESNYNKQAQEITGASFIITGDVTEFGRKVIGDHQLFGILGSGKKQIAYAKVSLNVIDVKTSNIVYSTQGAGEYSLSDREIIGFGGTSSYDATLNGKVLNFAITEAVNNLVADLDSGSWGR